jgi:amino acid transporter
MGVIKVTSKEEGIDWQHAEQCSKVVCQTSGLERTIDWKQGLAIAIGVPLLILPSIGYFANYLWSFAIIVWGLSVFQGFMQNLAYGELATTFPNASGLPGLPRTCSKEMVLRI